MAAITASFNEAGGFLPRKPAQSTLSGPLSELRFNEAGGFLPRKPRAGECPAAGAPGASMRPGDFSPGNVPGIANYTVGDLMLQ